MRVRHLRWVSRIGAHMEIRAGSVRWQRGTMQSLGGWASGPRQSPSLETRQHGEQREGELLVRPKRCEGRAIAECCSKATAGQPASSETGQGIAAQRGYDRRVSAAPRSRPSAWRFSTAPATVREAHGHLRLAPCGMSAALTGPWYGQIELLSNGQVEGLVDRLRAMTGAEG